MSEITKRLQREAAREVRDGMGLSEGPSRRGLGAPVRTAFFVKAPGEHPMASLMSGRQGSGGGRGGRTRLALLLSLIWVASGQDHSTHRPASFWARLLGMPDPGETGARTVNSTWAELERRGFVKVQRGPHAGAVSQITLLDESASGAPYRIPTGSEGDRYIRVPEALWLAPVLTPEVTGPGLALYLVTLRTYGLARNKDRLTFPAGTFHDRYGLSESTRKKGLKNLDDLLILMRTKSVVDDSGGVGHRLRPRNTYELAPHLLPPASGSGNPPSV